MVLTGVLVEGKGMHGKEANMSENVRWWSSCGVEWRGVVALLLEEWRRVI